MRCPQCRGENLKSTRVDYTHPALGVPVMLSQAEVIVCADCGEEQLAIPQSIAFHAGIAEALIRKPGKLSPAEIRWLRKYLELSSMAFADQLGIARATLSRWEQGKQEPGPIADRLIRSIVAFALGILLTLKELRAVGTVDGDEPIVMEYTDGHWRQKTELLVATSSKK